MNRYSLSTIRRFLAACLTLVSCTTLAQGQPPPPVAPNPQAPKIDMPAPLGVQRGSSIDLILTGANLAGPAGLWTSFPAQVTIPTDQNNGKDNAKLRVRLEVPQDAPLGFHGLRLATTRGMSNLRLFCVDDLPQVMESDTNRSRTTAQPVPVPCVVAGRTDPESSDHFKIHVTPGQRVSFEILGHRLGSPVDPQLTLYDGQTGRELTGGHSNDAPGLQTDARLTYTFKQGGDYVIEVRDVTYRGGGDFWYRLRIGDFPCATTPIPMAARRGSQVRVNFAGPAVDGVAPVEVVVPTDPTIDSVTVAPRGANGLYGWPVLLAVSDFEEIVEQEPNNDLAHATRVPVPGGVTGRFLDQGDVDHFVFKARKGQRYLIEVQTHELHSPAELYLVIKDAKGGQLAASNPMAGPTIDFTAPADGDLFLMAEHLLYTSGPSESYRITITPYEPGFDLALGIDRLDVAPGSVTAVSILASRRDYGGPIEVDVVGPPGISGRTTVRPGQPAPNQPAATLYLTAQPEVLPGPQEILIRGSAVINGRTVVHYANQRAVISQELSGLPFPPRALLRPMGLAITTKPPFTLVARMDTAEGARGTAVPLTLLAQRAPGFVEEIVLTPGTLPPNVGPALKNIPKGQSEVKVHLNAAVIAPLGDFTIVITGKARFQNVDFTVTTQPVTLALGLPFALQVEPPVLPLVPGGKAKIKVTALRKGGYAGPIALEIRNLPANVTAPKAVLAMGQTMAEIEVIAAGNAAIANRADTNVLGTATAAGNQQNASPNFTVSVGKK